MVITLKSLLGKPEGANWDTHGRLKDNIKKFIKKMDVRFGAAYIWVSIDNSAEFMCTVIKKCRFLN
jgi:hypothetical protein